MPDVNVTQNQVNVTPDTSTLSITTSPVEVTVQQSATPSVAVDTSKNIVEVTQPTAEVVVALATGPQGPQGVAGSGGGVSSYNDLSDIPSGIISSSQHIFTAITTSGDISASGNLIVGGGITFDGDETISTIGASDDLTVNPKAALNLGTAEADVIRIGRQSGTGGAGRTEIYANTSTIAAKFSGSQITFNHPVTASSDLTVEGTIKTKLDGGSF